MNKMSKEIKEILYWLNQTTLSRDKIIEIYIDKLKEYEDKKSTTFKSSDNTN